MFIHFCFRLESLGFQEEKKKCILTEYYRRFAKRPRISNKLPESFLILFHFFRFFIVLDKQAKPQNHQNEAIQKNKIK